MIKAEWRYLLKHKLLLIVVIVIGFIPSIYAVTFLKSMWDPYGQLKDLPVAVVDQDQPVTYQGTKMKVGHQLSQQLAKSTSLEFKVVDSEYEAQQGLKNGKYYMVVTIPKHFSKNATTMLNKQPKKMVLHYTTSSGHNFTAGKLTATAAQKIANNVSEKITKTYAKTMFASIEQLSQGLTSAGKHNRTIAKGDKKLLTANQTMTRGLNQLSKSTLTLSSGAKTLTTGLDQYISGVKQATAGSQQVTTGLDQLLSSTGTLASGVQKLATGSTQLNSGVKRYTAGVGQANTAAGKLQTGC